MLDECAREGTGTRQKLTPFGLDPEENPHPSAHHLQHLHQEDAAFKIIKVVQVW